MPQQSFRLPLHAEVFGAPKFSVFELLIVATLYSLLLATLWDHIQGWTENRLDPNRTIKIDQKGFAMCLLVGQLAIKLPFQIDVRVSDTDDW